MNLRDFEDRFYVVRDPEEPDLLLMIRGKKRNWGTPSAFVWGETRLAVFLPTLTLANNLMKKKIPGLKVEQQGKNEHIISFPIKSLDQVADAIGLKRRKKPMTPEEREKAVASIEKFRFPTRYQRRFSPKF